ncbi:MAG: response regulator transcription factor [Elusimicrobia bacterium]|nr:response regulator transcription factor [Elusimicrobiota bacterium]
MNKDKRIAVFLVDDHPILRDGVRRYLTSHSIMVVGEASDAKEALRKLKKLAPDVIVVDVSLPDLDGGELTRRLRRIVPKAKIVAFSIMPTARLVEAIVRVSQGGLHFPAGMTDAILAPGAVLSPEVALTPREREVLSLLSEGLTNRKVARKLRISVRTAESHRDHLLRKLNNPTMAELKKYAIEQGLTSLKA